MSTERFALAALTLFAAAPLVSCGNDTTARHDGTLEVSVSTTGTDFDADGYLLFFNGPTSLQRDIGVNASEHFTLPVGSYSVTLGSVRFNCQANGANSHTVEIAEDANVPIQFSVACTQRPVASLVIVPKPTSLGGGESLQLSARPLDSEGALLDGLAVTWASSSAAQATISSTGLVLGRDHGSVTITATVDGKAQGFALEIGDPAASLTLDPPSIALGGTTCSAPLTAVLRDAQGKEITGRQVNWGTNKGLVAFLSDPLGMPVSAVLVSSIANGTATVTATTGLLTSSAAVTVTGLSPECQE